MSSEVIATPESLWIEPIVISNSSIQTFKDCRRKFWLTYYRRLKKKEQKFSGPLALGTRIHKALELYYGEIVKTGDSNAVDITAIWSELIEEDRILIEASGWSDENFDNEAELGRIMLEGYIQWIEDEGIDAELEIVSQEEKLSVSLLDGRVHLIAKIDQRVKRKADGARFIRDFKTTANLSELTKTIQMNEQFLTYMVIEAMQRDEDSRVAGALVTALRKVKRTAAAKPPFYAQEEAQHNVFTLRNFYRRLLGELEQIVDFWDAMEEGEDHQKIAYPTPSRDCSWKCEFNQICPMFDDGSDVEKAIKDLYSVGDPYDYYEDVPEGTTK